MIKVIHVITDMKIGGAGKWLLNFLKYFDRSKLDIKVVIPTGSMLKEEINSLGLETIEISGIGDRSLDWASVSAFRNLFKKECPQIVHTHASLSARIAAKLAGVKTIINTKHCIDAPIVGAKKAVSAFINNQLSSNIIAISEAVRRNLADAGIDEKRIRMIYGGVEEVEKLSEEEIKQIKSYYGIKEDEVVFGIAARLAPVKGHKFLLEAAEKAIRETDNIKFVIAGTGPLENELKELATNKGIEDSVVFAGFVKEVGRMYNIFDVNMITSTSEAQCLALLEGMSLGKPMIGTAVGGVPELVLDGETGLLVPPGDADALTEAILRLAKDETLRTAMGQKAQRMMKEKFSASLMVEEIQKLYEEAVK